MTTIQLREGNLVYKLTPTSPRLPTGEIFKVAEITDNSIELVSADGKELKKNKLLYKDVAPILLTDHWRELLGLIYKPDKDEWVWNNNHIDWSLTKFEEWRKEQYVYVHEIQNLFYFMHDTELELRELVFA